MTGSGATRQNVGGLVGYNSSESSIVASYATGVVTGSSDWGGVGGLVGYNSAGSIVASYATGAVTGSDATRQSVGGLVGYNGSEGGIVASYATGAVTGSSDWGGVGGLVGYNSSAGSIVASYATGAVMGSGATRQSVGGLVGYNGSEGSISGCYWNTETSGQASSAGGEGKTTVELQSPTGYTGIFASWNVDLDNADGDDDATTGSDDPWDFGTAQQYPALRADFDGDGAATWQEFGRQRPDASPTTGETTGSTAVSYDTDGDGLIEIDNLAQLNAIRWDLDGDGAVDNAANESSYASAFPDAAAGMGCAATCIGYELVAGLSFDENGDGRVTAADGGYWNGGAGWAPIGGFSATLEGNLHVIAHLYIDRAAERNVGLFSQISDGAKIRNVGLNEITVTGGRNSGGLVGQNSGAISSSYATGSVTGGRDTGGLVGLNWSGAIIASYAIVSLESSGPSGGAGGLVGLNWRGAIVASYAAGSVRSSGSSSSAGGLVGDNWTGTSIIIASYAAGSVRASGLSSSAGGLVGQNSGAISSSYWDTKTSGRSTSAGGVGKTTAELQSPTDYTGIYANWDLDLDNADGDNDPTTGGDDPWDFGTSSQYPLLNLASLRVLSEIRFITLICDRTQQVRDEIVAKVPAVSTCGDVTTAHLAAITSLDLQRKSISLLKTGDFAGLTSLRSLDLVSNQLTTLPDGIFSELAALTYLGLSVNRMTTLPAGLFDELTTLTKLSLADNNLTSLPTGVFDKITALTDLRLQGNGLASLPAGIFDKLTNLSVLYLADNDLTSLPSGLFNEVTGLTELYLHRNELTALPDGVFDGLTGLAELWLGENSVDPLPIIVSLEKDRDGQLKATAPTGAPFDIVLPIIITNGSIRGGATTIVVPTGSTESGPLTLIRTPGTSDAVTVDLGTLPGLPTDLDHNGYPNHKGYTLVKSTDLPLEMFTSGETGTTTATTDFNGDGRVDFVDFFLFADAYGSTNAKFDLDGNGTVDFADFFKFVDAFGS